MTTELMKAVVYERYGSPDVLRLAEIPRPIPTDDQLLIRIHAVSLNGSDREGLTGEPLYARMRGLRRPGNPILGSDIAGRVEAVGRNNTEFKPGDEVFGEIPGYHGGLAEYVCTDGSTMSLKPASMTFEEAAAIPQAGVIALHGIVIKGQVQAGQKVLINGGAGSAGSFAIQLARMCGAVVTGVDNARKLDFMRSLGADHVIDYEQTDFTATGEQYDLILDLIAHGSVLAYARALRPNGRYLMVGGSLSVALRMLALAPWLRRMKRRHFQMLIVPQNRDDLNAITRLCEAGHVIPPIDRRFHLDDAPEALRYIVDGHARGKVVITAGVPDLDAHRVFTDR
jgi:NADPH:quinone reductase-like Zn-dependent oxidoreductase